MRGEPEVGVEHGAHHFHRIAGKRKVMGDDEGDKSNHAGDNQADGIFPESFQNQSKDAGAPADEDGRGIKIGHGRPAFEQHPEEEAAGVNGQSHQHNGHRGAPQPFKPRGCKPEAQHGNKRDDVENHRFVKRFEVVEQLLLGRFFQLGRNNGRQGRLIITHRLVKPGDLSAPVGTRHFRIRKERKMSRFAPGDVRQAFHGG